MTEKKRKNLKLSRKRKAAPPASTPSPLMGEGEDEGGRSGKGGFYARVMDEAEALDFETASGAEGLDDEITLLRVKIKALLENDPKNVRLLMAATKMLAVLVKARYSMNKKQEKNLGEAIKNIIRDIGVPLGTAILNKKL
jgi:hypothetical protein